MYHHEGKTYKPTVRQRDILQIYNKSKPKKIKEEKHTRKRTD